MNQQSSRIRTRYRYPLILLKQLVKTDFKLRYQNSILGYVWSLLRPLALFAILYIIFVKFLKVGNNIPHYPVYLLLGVVIWNYFAEATIGSVNSIVNKGDLMRKINFPRYVIVLAGSFSALINLLLNFVVVAIFLVIGGVEIRLVALLAPLLIIELFVFALSISFFLSAAFVRFRDITFIWEVAMQGAFYATPILYPITLIPAEAARWLILSPIAQIIQDLRYLLVTPQTSTISSIYGNHYIRLVPIGITLLIAVIASRYFRSRAKYFAEDV